MLRVSAGPIITLFPSRTLHHSAMIAPNVQILSPISQVRGPLVLRGAVDGFVNVLADACPRPCLLERLAAAQLGPGGVTLLTDELSPRRIYLSHTQTQTATVAEFGAGFYCTSSCTGMKIGCFGVSGLCPTPALSQPLVSPQSRQNTHANGESNRGDLRRKLRCISQSDELSSLDDSVDIS